MIRFRSGYLVAPTYVSRYLKCLSDRILACLPAMAFQSQFGKQSYNIVRMAAAQFELFAREQDIVLGVRRRHTNAQVLNVNGPYFDLVIGCDYAQICGASSSLTESVS
jgi:hypothetical protein